MMLGKIKPVALSLAILGALLIVVSCDQTPSTDRETWAKIYQDPKRPSIYPDYRLSLAATPTPDGGFILNQYADNTLANDTIQDRGSALIKVDAAGTILWQKKYDLNIQGALAPVENSDTASFICIGQDEEKKECLMKIDQEGGVIWKKSYGEAGSHTPLGISINEAGDAIFVSGSLNDSQRPEESGAFYAKLDLYGNLLWEKSLVDNQEEHRPFDLYHAPSSGDGIFIWSNHPSAFLGKIDGDGHALWSRSYLASEFEPEASSHFITSVNKTQEGGCVVTGLSTSFHTAEEKIWIMKLDALGDQEWSTRLEAPLGYYPLQIRRTQDGGYAILGFYLNQSYVNLIASFLMTLDKAAFLMKLDSQGQIVWQKSYRDESMTKRIKPESSSGLPLILFTSNSVEAFSFNEAADGGYVFTGHLNYQQTYPVPEEGTEYEQFVARTDTQGRISDTDLIVREMSAKNSAIHISSTEVTLTANDRANILTDAAATTTEVQFTVIDL